MSDIAAILLAAGRSRRMGKFKPLLPFGDRTVIEACLLNLQGAGVEETVVVVGHRADDIRDYLKAYEITFALNADPDSAMGESIAAGVSAVSPAARAVLIALVDHPAIPSEIISDLIAEWHRGHARIVQPEYEGHGGHPVLIDLSYRHELLGLDPARGLRALIDSHRTDLRRLPTDCPYVARDMDTWEDYLRLHEEVFGRPHDET